MRVLLDTNIFISYLLSAKQGGAIEDILTAVKNGHITLLMPADLLEELQAAIRRKPHLHKHITPYQMDTFITLLQALCELLPPIEEPIPALCRDPKDDYLLAYAVVGNADYLVSGDKDLLELDERVKRQLRPLRIMALRPFVQTALTKTVSP